MPKLSLGIKAEKESRERGRGREGGEKGGGKREERHSRPDI